VLSKKRGGLKSDNRGDSKKSPTIDIYTKDIYKEDNFEFQKKVSIPKNIFLTDKMKEYVRRQGCENSNHAENLFEDFCNHHASHGKKFTNWTRTFQTWVRNDKKYYNPDKYKVWVDTGWK
jgi:hypothetical protein